MLRLLFFLQNCLKLTFYKSLCEFTRVFFSIVMLNDFQNERGPWICPIIVPTACPSRSPNRSLNLNPNRSLNLNRSQSLNLSPSQSRQQNPGRRRNQKPSLSPKPPPKSCQGLIFIIYNFLFTELNGEDLFSPSGFPETFKKVQESMSVEYHIILAIFGINLVGLKRVWICFI